MGIRSELQSIESEFISLRDLVLALAQSEGVPISDAARWLLLKLESSSYRLPRGWHRDEASWNYAIGDVNSLLADIVLTGVVDRHPDDGSEDDGSDGDGSDGDASDGDASDGDGSDGDGSEDDASEGEALQEIPEYNLCGFYKDEIREFLEDEGLQPPSCCEEDDDDEQDDHRKNVVSRKMLLKIITLLCKRLDIDVSQKGASQAIATMTEVAGSAVNDDTIRRMLGEISGV